MTTYQTIANVKGPQGIRGLPGVLALNNDVATAALIEEPTSDTSIALSNRIPVGVNVKAFGAVGDKVTDDTIAIQAAIDYAQTLVRDAGTPAFNKQQDGATVYFPKGMYKITGTLLVSESNIMVEGESSSASVLYAPSATFDLLQFDNPSYALYNNGVRNLKFSTPGNATAGFHLTVAHAIYFTAENLLLNGWFGGLRLIGGGKLMFRSIMFSQEVRALTTTTTGAAIQLDNSAEYLYPSDVHFTDIQIMEDIAYAGVDSVVINGCDGVYFNNCHLHGTVKVSATGTVPVYTLIFTNVYFDGSRDVCVDLGGNPVNGYEDIRFVGCYFRGSVSGLKFSAARIIKSVIVSACRFAQNQLAGLDMTNANQVDVVITGCVFDGNNTSNDAASADVKLNGSSILLTNSTFTGGGAAGYGVIVDAAADFVTISDVGFVNSAVTLVRRILDGGTDTKLRGNLGWITRDRNVHNVPSGATTYTAAHGCQILPTLQSITLTPGASCPAHWVSNITATTFQINFASATSGIIPMGYEVNMES